MDDIRVEYDRGGALRTITLARPEKRNALTPEMFAVLTDAFVRPPDPSDRVTLIRAEGPAFCGGVDLGRRAEGAVEEGESPLERLCAAVRAYPLPVVAAVQGAAIGGGFMLLVHCDFVVAATDAKLGNAAVQLGIVPPWPMTRGVLEASGPALARRLLLLGELVFASELAGADVITAAVAPEALDGEIDRLVDRLLANAPLSLRAVKATLHESGRRPAPHPEASERIRLAQVSEDAKEGVAARREKRRPRFQGR